MDFSEKGIRKFTIVFLIAVLAVLVFLILRPVLLSILGGLILAYVFFPLYSRVQRFVKERNAAAGIVSLLVILIILVPLWFLVPVMVQQIFNLFTSSQTIDFRAIITAIFPTSSEQFVAQTVATLSTIVSRLSSAILNSLIDIFIEIPTIALHLFIVAFVFFFSLRDSEKLKEMASSISPFNKIQEKVLVKQFKDISDSIIYGQVIVGLVQGILAGLGFILFGVDNALVLTLLAILLSIVPLVGPSLVWIPIVIYFFASGNTEIGIVYLLYNLLIVSTIDNLLRSYIVSKKADISAAVVMVGMIGGLFMFGFLGLILGPLILAYFLTFLRAYRDKTLSSLFAE